MHHSVHKNYAAVVGETLGKKFIQFIIYQWSLSARARSPASHNEQALSLIAFSALCHLNTQSHSSRAHCCRLRFRRAGEKRSFFGPKHGQKWALGKLRFARRARVQCCKIKTLFVRVCFSTFLHLIFMSIRCDYTSAWVMSTWKMAHVCPILVLVRICFGIYSIFMFSFCSLPAV